MNAIIEGALTLAGPEFSLVEDSFLQIEGSKIKTLSGVRHPAFRGTRYDGKGLIAMPGMVNAHVHLGDSVVKDIGVGSTMEELVHPITGLKSRILKEVPRKTLVEGMRESLQEMLANGITTIADFRETGLEGLKLLKKSAEGLANRLIALGRPSYYSPPQDVNTGVGLPTKVLNETERVLQKGNGLGVSGPNEFTDQALIELSSLARKARKLVAVHVGEAKSSAEYSIRTFGSSEVSRALTYLRPHILVHLVHTTRKDIEKICSSGASVVCCPRANAILGHGFPPITDLLRLGVNVALGTDNVMLNSCDMFREMDYASKMSRAGDQNPNAIKSADVLRMATLGGAKALKLQREIGSLEEEKVADIVFLNSRSSNLRFSKDIVSSIVHRARPDDIVAVMVQGELVHGSLPRCNSK